MAASSTATQLRRIGRLTVRAREVAEERDEAIRAASRAGATVRAIASAAGLSPARVHQIIHGQ